MQANGSVGRYSSLALDSNDFPHITHIDENIKVLYYVKWMGSEWETQLVANTAWFNSLALDKSGTPHVAYANDNPGSNVIYSRWTGAAWTSEVAASNGWLYPSIALDTNDLSRIVYGANDGNVRLTVYTNGAWTEDFINNPGWSTRQTDLAYDSLNRPHVTFSYQEPRTKYTVKTGTTWIVQTLTANGMGERGSVVVDSQDVPHIATAASFPLPGLKYARQDPAGWEYDTIDPHISIVRYVSIDVDSRDFPHISFNNDTNGDLRYATWETDVLSIESQPTSAVPISVTVTDTFGNADGATDLTRAYLSFTDVEFTAPTSHNGIGFTEWTKDGAPFSTNPQVSFTTSNNHQLVALYDLYTLTMDVDPAQGGTSSPPVGVHTRTNGVVVPLTANTNLYYAFDYWSGEVADSNAATTTVTMDKPQQVTAHFQALTAAMGAPLWWLVLHGLTNDSFDVEETKDVDSDGKTAYEEWVGNTIPTNAASVLEITGIQIDGAGQIVLTWSSASNRFYTVRSSSNIVEFLNLLTSGLPARPPENTYTSPPTGADTHFYWIEVNP